MLNTRFLLFRGGLQNEGNLWALESNDKIIIAAAGVDNPQVTNRSVFVNIDYLREHSQKIGAVFIGNSSLKNSGLLGWIYRELDLKVPIYTSKFTKTALQSYCNYSKTVIANITEVERLVRDIEVGTFSLSFFQLDSYLVGNLAVAIYNQEEVFYYFEDFSFNVLSNNDLLFKPFFFQKFRKFLMIKRKRIHLVVGCQNLKWNNNGSLSLEADKFVVKNKDIVLMIYDFDLLHILESLEIAQRAGRNVNVLDWQMFLLLRKLLERHPLLETIKFNSHVNGVINLFTTRVEEMERKILDFSTPNSSLLFVSCLFPMSGAEERLARVIDFLHSQGNQVLNLGRSENLSIGTNFYDLKFILKNLNPSNLLLLQNSYKHSKYLSNLKSCKPIIISNQHYLNIRTKKILPIRSSKVFMNMENLLFFQREKLLKSGLLVVFFSVFWENSELKISKVRIKSLAISTIIDIVKLEKKIKQWWNTKISSDISPHLSDSNVKQNIERRLSGLVRNYLSFENDVEMEDPLFLLFVRDKKVSYYENNEG